MSTASRDVAKQTLLSSINKYELITGRFFHEIVGDEESQRILDNLDTFSIAYIYGLRDKFNAAYADCEGNTIEPRNRPLLLMVED